VDDRILPGNDLGLPDQDDGHHAHAKNAKRQNNARLSFRSWDMKDAPNEIHDECLLQSRIANGLSRTVLDKEPATEVIGNLRSK
jgi:hypothetical protein